MIKDNGHHLFVPTATKRLASGTNDKQMSKHQRRLDSVRDIFQKHHIHIAIILKFYRI